MAKYNVNEPEVENFDDKNYVRIPVENKDIVRQVLKRFEGRWDTY